MAGSKVECQLTRLSLWPEGSLRWVLVECFVDIEASDEVELVLQLNS